MLRLIDVAIARGARTLYRNVSLIAPPGERIGLVGANGSGKSSLFSAILGELSVDAGELEAPPAARIAHVAQDIEGADLAAIDRATLAEALRPGGVGRIIGFGIPGWANAWKGNVRPDFRRMGSRPIGCRLTKRRFHIKPVPCRMIESQHSLYARKARRER